jgi:hypothetical protein
MGGPIVLVWDNLNTHISAVMKRLIAARSWLTVFQLPAYAPELIAAFTAKTGGLDLHVDLQPP